MKCRILPRSLCMAMVLTVSWIVGFYSGPATGQEKAKRPAAADKKATDKKAADKNADKKAPQKKEELSGRLPPYYKDVVDDAQREKIYAIQAEYANQIERLKQQLADLEEERDQRIDAVLTPQQKAKVQAAQAEAKAKRTAKKAKEKLKPPGKK